MANLEFRVTKYNPVYRNAKGHFLKNDWTMFGQIGQAFDGEILTFEKYANVENAYAETASAFLRESGEPILQVEGLEDHGGFPFFQSGDWLQGDDLKQAFRDVLRERYWCRFVDRERFVHFGWDFYMYIGTPIICERAMSFASAAGLFVEPFISPYHKELNED